MELVTKRYKSTSSRTLLSHQIVWVFVHLIALTFAASSFEKDTTLTYGQKVTLDKFKQKVIDRLPHDYMKTNLYLIRWLRARNYNIDQAEQMLNENLKWRREQNIDEILNEEW